MTEKDLWERLLHNAKLWCSDELYGIFKKLHDNGAKLEQKTVKAKNADIGVPALKLTHGKYSEEEWKNRIIPQKLQPHTDAIKEIFLLTTLGTLIDIKLTKDIPDGSIEAVTARYAHEIMDFKQCGKEFGINMDGRELWVVPYRTKQNRTEITVEELYLLKWLVEYNDIEEPLDYIKWVA